MYLLALDDVIWNAIIVGIATVVVSIIQTVGMVLSKRRDDRTAQVSKIVAEQVQDVKKDMAVNTEVTVRADAKLAELAKVVDDVAVNAEATQSTVARMKQR